MENLFTEDISNTKLAKSAQSLEYMTIGLFLAPYTLNNLGVNLCPYATKECAAACLNTAGLASVFSSIARARKRKARLFVKNRNLFMSTLREELSWYHAKAQRQGKSLVCRLNGTSDIDYPRSVFESYPNVQFYDYTKSPYRMRKYLKGDLPTNYHLTFSFSGENLSHCLEFLHGGGNVSVVFESLNFPETWHGFKVINGEETDLRFLDPRGVVVGLKAKGKARAMATGGFIQIGRA